MKRAYNQFIKWIAVNYPPIVLSILFAMAFVGMCALLSLINYMTTPDLPIQYQ